MKRFYTLLIIFSLFLAQGMKAQTIIEDGTVVSGTWTKAGSPYIIQGKAEIPDKDTLTIEPGVEVRFKTGTNFVADFNTGSGKYDCGWILVKGSLIASGTEQDSILFTRNSNEGYWGGITTYYGDHLRIDKCIFQYSNGFRNFGDYVGIGWQFSTSEIKNSRFNSNKNKVISKAKKVENCLFTNNENICLDDCDTIQHSVFYNNEQVSDGYSFLVSGNLIHNNKYGLTIECDGYGEKQSVFNNVIYNNERGLYLYAHRTNHSNVNIFNNTITSNKLGLLSGYFNGNIFNNIVYQNEKDIQVLALLDDHPADEQPICKNNLIVSGDVRKLNDLENNIFIDVPVFRAANEDKFLLVSNSPCINGGADLEPDPIIEAHFKTDYNGNTRIQNGRIDMGAFEYSGSFIYFKETLNNHSFKPGYNFNLSWNTNLNQVKLDYSTNLGDNWTSITTTATKDFVWVVPNGPIENGILRISSPSDQTVADTILLSVSDTTKIPDKTLVYGVWSREMSPVIVQGEAIVPLGKTLTIEPGVEVLFKTGNDFDYYNSTSDVGILIIDGSLFANGNNQDSIKFKGNSDGNWGCLVIKEGISSTTFNYCSFSKTGNVKIEQISHPGACINIKGVNIKINNSTFKECDSDHALSIDVRNKPNSISLNNISVSGFSTGINALGFQGEIMNSQISNCITAIRVAGNAVIENVKISNCEIGIDAMSTIINNCSISDCNYAIKIGSKSSDRAAKINVYNSIFYDNEYAFDFNYSFSCAISNNIIFGNDYLVRCISDAKSLLSNNIFLNNSKGVDLNSNIQFSNCFFNNDSLASIINGEENIFAFDPLLADIANFDFTPLPGSPLIDAGKLDTLGLHLPSFDIKENPRISNGRIDIGPVEFQNDNNYIRITEPYRHKYMVSFLTDTLQWVFSDSTAVVNLKYSADNGNTWQIISENEPNNGEYVWNVPELISDSCLIAITDKNNPAIADTSKYVFTISPNRIPDGKSLQGTWFEKYSPYQVMGHVIINSGDSLIIEPGVTIKMKTGKRDKYGKYLVGVMQNKGYLKSEGKANKPILYTRLEEEGNWGKILIDYNCDKTSILKNSYIEYSNEEQTNDFNKIGVIYCGNSITIENCIIHNNEGSAIAIMSNRIPRIKNCIITKNTKYAIRVVWGASTAAKIENSIIIGNNEGICNSLNGIDSIKYSLVELSNEFVSNYHSHPGILINKNAQFLDSQNGNYKLRPNSPCIDAGDPNDDFSQEPEPNGGRINIGAYGNTPWAASFQPLPRIDELSISECTILGFDTLHIKGRYFLENKGNGSVFFGETEAQQYLYWADDSLVCVVPPHAAGAVSITIKNNDNLESVYKQLFTYVNPVITDIRPINSLPQGNIPITITGSGFGSSVNSTQLLFGPTQAVEYLYWSNDSVVVTCPAGDAGFADLSFESLNNTSKQFAESFLYSSSGITEVCGTASGIWESGQTYLLTCPVEIPQGSELSIEEGVTIIAKLNTENKVALTNNGTLLISGTENNPVQFKSLPAVAGNWEGIILNKPGEINHTIISYAVNGVDIRTSNTVINHVAVRNCSENGIYLNGDEHTASATITNCTLTDNIGYGIEVKAVASEYRGSAGGTISENLIFGNTGGGIAVTASGYAPWSTSTRSGTAYASPVIEKNRIYENQGPGIYCSSYGDQEEAVQGGYITRGGTTSPEIYQNLIYKNKSGLETYQGRDYAKTEISAANNVFYSNGISITEGKVLFHNNVVWGDDTKVENNGLFEAKYSLLPELVSGNGNISRDPLFISPIEGDFSLQESSPCIDAGSNEFATFAKDFDGKVRIWDSNGDGTATVDIGAYEFGSIAETVPVITRQPVGGSFCPGSNVELSVKVTAYPDPEYQWYRNDTIINGAIADELILPEPKAGSYTCSISNTLGSVTTEPAQVILFPVYDISLEETICQGESFNIGVESFSSDTTIIQNLISVSGCDSIVTTHLTVHPVYEMEEEITICEGTSHKGWTESGTYTENLVAVSGCDSTVVTRLSVNDVFDVTEEIEICTGESYLDWNENGNYSRTLQSVSGCDSIVTTHLTVHPVYEMEEEITICEGTSHKGWTESGTYTENLVAVSGCDSTVVTRLSVNDVFDVTEEIEICAGESYLDWNKTGSYTRTLQSVSGCDSIVTTHLTMHPVYELEQEVSICERDSWKGWIQSGTYTENLVSVFGCDSTVVTRLTVNDAFEVTEEVEICAGESYLDWNKTGTYTRTLQSVSGCDSIVTTHLTMHPVYELEQEVSICEGDSWKGWIQSGTYTENLVSVFGCDSTVVTRLSVNNAFEVSEEIEICAGESYVDWNKTGSYTRTLQSVSGCDSIVTTYLTVYPVYTMEEDISICDGASWKGWIQPGTYTENLVAVSGCDSTVVTRLSVTPMPATPVLTQNADTLTASGEGVFTWYFEDNPIEGAISSEFIIEESGSYSVIVTSGQGCVSPVSESLYAVKTAVRSTVLNNLKVYPNPTSGKVTIEGFDHGETAVLQVFNSSGEKIYYRNVTETKTEIDLSGFASGVYHFSILIQNKNAGSFRVVKK
jgi:hypothetical protein